MIPMPALGPDGEVPRTSRVILDLALTHRSSAVALGEIVDGLRERAFGLVFILLAVGNLVPLPPGVSGLLGFGIAAFALQLLLGGAHPGCRGRCGGARSPATGWSA